MGIRCDQWIGLNDRARSLVEGNNVVLYVDCVERTYPDGRVEVIPPTPVYGSDVEEVESERKVEGMFEREYALADYILPDGTVCEEHLQAAPWSSGPMFFTALKRDGEWIPETLWKDSEMAE